LRVLASTGATLRPEVQKWLEQHVCGDHGVVTDTWWQCESGAIMLAGKTQAASPLPGLSVEVVDDEACSIIGETGQLAVSEPWPAMMRGVWDAPRRYRESYWPMSGEAFISGDIAQADRQGGIRLLGRAQDRINTEQGWIAPLEIEALLNLHESVAESMVVGVKDAGDTTVIVGFVVLEGEIEPSDELATELLRFVNENSVYPSCMEKTYIAPGLPRTSDGKYMRHLLRDVATGQNFGDTTALLDSRLIGEIQERAAYPENWCWNTGPVAPGKVVLVDIDGVIADARERMQGIETGRHRWPDFFKTVGDDELIGEVAHLLELISSDFIIVLLSARPLNSQNTTIEWLHRHKVRWDLMILRATSSMQRPAHYKRHRTRELRERGFEPVFSLEDDPRNVEMYREEGVPCLYIHSGIHTA